MQNFIIKITQENFNLLDDPRIGCYILVDNLSREYKSEFISKAHERKKIVLVQSETDFDDFKILGIDGIIIDTSKDANPCVKIKGFKKQNPKAILGVICRNRRHESMIVSECEPEFVIFRFWQDGFVQNLELLNWYNELFLIQSAVMIEENVDFTNITSDFIILDDQKYQIFVAK